MTEKESSKWQEIFGKLQKDLRDGVYAQGEPLPSEGALMRKYRVSRRILLDAPLVVRDSTVRGKDKES